MIIVTSSKSLFAGPAPLEAIANGAIFLNPKFSPPRGRGNTDFFNGKPTSRNLTSQHPYVEEFVQHAVITVDISDIEAVKKAVEGIKRSDVSDCWYIWAFVYTFIK